MMAINEAIKNTGYRTLLLTRIWRCVLSYGWQDVAYVFLTDDHTCKGTIHRIKSRQQGRV